MLRTTRPISSAYTSRLALTSRAASSNAYAQRLTPSPRPLFPKVGPRIQTPLILRTALSTKSALQISQRDKAFEKETAKKILEPRPDEVSTQSSVRHVVEQSQAPPSKNDTASSLQGELDIVKDTFALKSVPQYPYVLGLASTLPYLGTSVATLYLSWDLNTTWPSTSNIVNNILISHDTASSWLHLLEPIQVGYGAVIVSFLGAIHWGLEFAEKNPSHTRTRFRYLVGVMAPIAAWPTVFMPVEWALMSQFLAFTGIYFADTHATTKGWMPHWYGTYRWVLTAIVGAAIFVSLVGRAKVGENRARLRYSELQELLRQQGRGTDKHHDWAKEEEAEKLRIKKEKEEEEKKRKQEEKKRKQEEKNNAGSKDQKKKEKKTDGKEDSGDKIEEEGREKKD